MSEFSENIVKFNQMYKMPVGDAPTTAIGMPLVKRLQDFKSILAKELDEIDDIIALAQAQEGFLLPEGGDAQLLTMLADLLGDIQVYCASEMVKFGLPPDAVLRIIMESNFSKMGADGKPIYDEQNKLQKGPGYWKPEPKIKALLRSLQLRDQALKLTEQSEALLKESNPIPAKESVKDIFSTRPAHP